MSFKGFVGKGAIPSMVRFNPDLYRNIVDLLEDPKKPGNIQYGRLSLYINSLVAKDMRSREAIGEEALKSMLENFGE